MASKGWFVLVTNTGSQDELLNATSFLKQRINDAILKKSKKYSQSDLLSLPKNNAYLNIESSALPSLSAIEQSHNTFINGTFKPYVPVSFSYVKIATTNAKFGTSVKFTLPNQGNFISDMVLNVVLTGLSALDPRDRVRYVSMVGHKLMESVSFTINGNPIDEYSSDEYNAYYKFEVTADKKIGYLRNVGQEIPNLGYMTSDPLYDMHREYRYIGNGPQTLKQKHDSVELFIPLLFWCRHIKNALPAFVIPWGQTDVTIKFANVSDIVAFTDYGGGGLYKEPTISTCALYANNIYTIPEITQLYTKKFLFSLIRVHKQHKVQLTQPGNGSVLLNSLKWPVELMYICFRPRANLNLSQYWHKGCMLREKTYKVPVVARNAATVITGTISSSTTSGSNASAVLVSVSLSGVDNTYNNYDFVITGGKGYNADDITLNRYTVLSYDGGDTKVILTTLWTGLSPDTTTTFELFTPQLAINSVSYYEETPVIKSLGLITHGIDIYEDTSEMLYNSYLPYKFGNAVVTPEDRGWYMQTFSLYPLNNQPSGTINFSQIREIYLEYKLKNTNDISISNPVDLLVLARTINFLIVDAGTAVLKYST